MRRSWLLALSSTVLLTACLASPGRPETRTTEPPAAQAGARLPPVGQLYESLGVNIHVSFDNTPYGKTGRLVQVLKDSGLKHVRDGLKIDRPDQNRALKQIAEAGLSTLLIFGNPDSNYQSGTVSQGLAWLLGPGKGLVTAVEGANEWDCVGGSGWKPELRAYQAAVSDAVSTSLRIPLVGPSFCRAGRAKEYGADQHLDLNNMHSYAAGRPPEQTAGDALADSVVRPGVPTWSTETGYHNALKGQPSQPGVSERAAAAYSVRTYLENARLGVPRTYLYELYDQFNDPGGASMESHFGLIRADGTPKPAYLAVRSLAHLTRDLTKAGPSGEPVAAVAVNDTGEDLRQLQYDAGNGRTLVLLWRAQSVYDLSKKADLSPPERPVRLIARQTASLSAADVGAGQTGFTDRQREGTSFSVQVGAIPQAFLLAPAPTAAPAVPTTPPAATRPPSSSGVVPGLLPPPVPTSRPLPSVSSGPVVPTASPRAARPAPAADVPDVGRLGVLAVQPDSGPDRHAGRSLLAAALIVMVASGLIWTAGTNRSRGT